LVSIASAILIHPSLRNSSSSSWHARVSVPGNSSVPLRRANVGRRLHGLAEAARRRSHRA
jgi:hypothetical protein